MKHTRRTFLCGALATPAASLVAACADAADPGKKALPAQVTVENFSKAGVSLGKVQVPTVVKTDEEWRRELPTLQASFDALGERLPAELRDELADLERRLGDA